MSGIVLIIVFAIIDALVLLPSTKKNADQSRREMQRRGQTHGVVKNTASSGSVFLVCVLIVVEVAAITLYLPHMTW